MLFGDYTVMFWRTRELAAVLASKWMQENLPSTAKTSQYMKQLTQGTNYVPSFRASETNEDTPLLKSLHKLETKDICYLSAIACFCLTFVYPAAVIGAVICVYRAKKCQKGGEK
jgi:hypothetical protein